MHANAEFETVAVPPSIQSPEGKLVYVYLATTGETSVVDLAAAISLPQLSVRSVLRELERHGLVVRSAGRVRACGSGGHFDE